jgi:uncharacterized protein
VVLKDRIVLVTGGSRGLGRSLTTRLADRGSVTVICGRTEKDLAAAAADIEGCSYVVADVTRKDDVQRLFLTILERFGSIDLLINNAGTGLYGPFLEASEEDLDFVMSVNLKGAFLCAQAAARIMRDQGEGCILNVLSGAAEAAFENLSVYCASKHALAGLTKSMRLELEPLGIRVLSVQPGYIRTGFFDDFPNGYQIPADAQPPDRVAEAIITLLEESPTRRGARQVLGRIRGRFPH